MVTPRPLIRRIALPYGCPYKNGFDTRSFTPTLRQGINRMTSSHLAGWVRGVIAAFTCAVAFAAPVGALSQAFTEAAGEAAVFASPDSCFKAVRAGARLKKAEHTVRLMTWNIRWFPVGNPKHPGQETNLDWLACALTWLDPDLVALQEIQDTPQAATSWAVVFETMKKIGHTGNWDIFLQSCGSAQSQHVGFLIDTTRLRATSLGDIAFFNGAAPDGGPTGSECAGNLRPGIGVAVAASGGLDFVAVSVHLDSGTEQRDFGHRLAVYDRFDDAYSLLSRKDSDVIILGDFNTMGMDNVPADMEIKAFRTKLENERPGFRTLEPPSPCSEYFNGTCGLLDHFTVVQYMEEAFSASAYVSGICSTRGGQPFSPGHAPLAYTQLSDHCPLIVDIADRDLD